MSRKAKLEKALIKKHEQTIATQKRVIEKLKVINRDFAWHYDECSSIVEDNAPCDCGLRKTRTEIATIEKGEA